MFSIRLDPVTRGSTSLCLFSNMVSAVPCISPIITRVIVRQNSFFQQTLVSVSLSISSVMLVSLLLFLSGIGCRSWYSLCE